MNLPTLIDVAIGLVLVFFLLATIGSVLAEMVAGWRKWRHKLLRETIDRLLEPDIAKKFWEHALIEPLFLRDPEADGLTRALTKRLGRLDADAPAYLDAQRFAGVVLDLATGEGAAGRLPATLPAWEHAIRTHVAAKPGANNDLQDRLLSLLRQIPRDTADCGAELKSAVAKWYDEGMQRASGIYRRKVQGALLVIGAGLALGLNCDALRIASVLYQSPALRQQVAQQAETLVKEKSAAPADDQPAASAAAKPADPAAEADDLKGQLKENVAQLRDLTKIGFPLGWLPTWSDNFIYLSQPVVAPKTPAAAKPPPGQPGVASYLAKFAGLLASALAVCLGAPFWFDVLGRLVKLRTSAGAEAEKKKSDAPPGPVAATAGAGGPSTAGPAAAPAAVAATGTPLPLAIDALALPSTEFSAARAYWLAEFADHAYETDRTALESWLKPHGFTLLEFIDVNGTQSFLARGEGVAVLAFRGTEKKLEDWVTDAKFKLVDGAASGVPGQVHDGFTEALANVAARLDGLVAQLKTRRVLLHLTGHSLGGALATLAALHFGRNPAACPVHTVHTFGSPRVGDAAFVQDFDQHYRGRSYRFVNDEDLVTRVPTRAQGYEHVGEFIYIDEAGRLVRDIGYWYRFLNFATNALGDLQQAVKTTVKDHSMKLYCGHLEKSARRAP